QAKYWFRDGYQLPRPRPPEPMPLRPLPLVSCPSGPCPRKSGTPFSSRTFSVWPFFFTSAASSNVFPSLVTLEPVTSKVSPFCKVKPCLLTYQGGPNW